MDKFNNIPENLRNAVDDLTPDVFQAVCNTPVLQQERIEDVMNKTNTKKSRTVAILAAAACFAVVGAAGVMRYMNSYRADSVISIDVNPAVEIITSKTNRVIGATAINEDGQAVLEGMNLNNSDLKAAVNAITDSIVKLGYFDDDGGVLVSVRNKNGDRAESVKAEVVSDINSALSENNKRATVLEQTVTPAEENDMNAIAEKYNISVGKAAFLYHLCQKDKTLSLDKLAVMNIYEIAQLVKSKNIDVSDIVDYDDDDDDLFDDLDDVFEHETNVTQAATANYIGEEKAIATALSNAKLDRSKTSALTVYLETDDGRKVYEVEFRSGVKEYDYEIDAVSGKIIDIDFEIELIADTSKAVDDDEYDDDKYDDDKYDDDKYDDDKYDDDADITSAAGDKTAYISEAKAKEIALAHAKLSESEVNNLTVKSESDDGNIIYDVEFRAGVKEYGYEIDAVSGKIIEAEAEIG